MKLRFTFVILAGALLATAAYRPLFADARLRPDVTAAMQRSFEAKRQATMARLAQDETQQLCTRYAPAAPPAAIAQ